MTEARYATAATPTRPNLLAVARRLAAVLGLTLMPHQEQIIGTLTERMPDGRPAYTDATCTLPRQAGKSVTLMILGILQALSAPNQRIVYTSTTGMAARRMMLDEWVPRMRASELNGLFKVRATNGAERILFDNGSTISLLSSSKHAGHGDTLHMILADELWCASEVIEQLRPTLITTGGVFLGFSTAGTPAESKYLLGRVEQGRRDVEAGVTAGRAYFEWSIDPADIDDVEAYVAINPAVGQTVTADDIRVAVGGMPKVEAARSFGNIFTAAMHDPVIPLERWLALEDASSRIAEGLVFAVDVSPDRKHASIGAAGRNKDDEWHVEVVESRPDVAWLPGRLRELVTKHSPKGVYIDSMSESFVPELKASGVAVEKLFSQAHASAFGFFVDAVAEGTLRHCPDAELLAALTSAHTRPLGDGGEAWSRRGSAVRIDGLVAVTLALWGAQLQPTSIGVWSLAEVAEKMIREGRIEHPAGFPSFAPQLSPTWLIGGRASIEAPTIAYQSPIQEGGQ